MVKKQPINKKKIIIPSNAVRKKCEFTYDKERVKENTKMIIIGHNFYCARKIRKLTQAELAKKAKTTQNIISKIEHGDYQAGLDLLVRISDILKFPIDMLLKGYIIEKDGKYYIEVKNSKDQLIELLAYLQIFNEAIEHSKRIFKIRSC